MPKVKICDPSALGKGICDCRCDPKPPLGQEKEFVRETGRACGSAKGIDD